MNWFFEPADPGLSRQYEKFNRANTSFATFAAYVLLSSVSFGLEIGSTIVYSEELQFLIILSLPAVLLVLNWYKLVELWRRKEDHFLFDALVVGTNCVDDDADASNGIALFQRKRSNHSMDPTSAEATATEHSISNVQLKSLNSCVPNIVVILTSVYYGLRLILKQMAGACETGDFIKQITCNYACPYSPNVGALLLVFIVPVVYPLIMREVRFRFVIVSVAIAMGSIATAAAIGGTSSWAGHVLAIVSASMAVICYESERQSLLLFVAMQRLISVVTENKRLADESIATDMRHLVIASHDCAVFAF